MGKQFKLPPEEQQRQLIVDVTPLKAVFQAQLEGFADGRLKLDGLKVMRYAYEPDQQFTLSYDLRVTDTHTGRSGKQSVFAVVALDGGAQERFVTARQAALLQPDFGPGLQLLPDLDMVVWGFPNDPQMPQLGTLLDGERLKTLLTEHWDDLGPPPARLVATETRTMKAVALRRCTLRHELTLADGQQRVVYSKTFGVPGSAERLFAAMSAVFESPVCRAGKLVIPEPLFVVPELEVVFIGDLGGVPIRDDLCRLDREVIGKTVGEALACLHQCVIDGLPVQPGDDMLRQAALAQEALDAVSPSQSTRLAAVVSELARRSPELTPIPLAPIHGAFRIAQLLQLEQQLALMDFDGLSLSNPITDVGGFVANLLYLSLRRRCTLDEALAVSAPFCRAYAAHAPWGLPADQLLWQCVGHLIGKHVKRSIKTGKSDGLQLVAGLLALSEELLAGRLVLAPDG